MKPNDFFATAQPYSTMLVIWLIVSGAFLLSYLIITTVIRIMHKH